MKSKFLLLNLLFWITSICILEAQKEITLEDIWKDETFQTNLIPGFKFMKDGNSYSKLEDNKINKYDLLSGEFEQTIWDGNKFKDQNSFSGEIAGYQFNPDESKIIIESETENIYRHSYKSKYHIADLKTNTFSSTSGNDKIQYCTLSPDGKKIAFVQQNNLYYMNMISGETYAITSDGKHNEIINGAADWVYEEEFSFAKAFFWSPDSESIAFLRFDESQVKEFTMTNYRDGVYPEYVSFKYPKVGEDNAIVSVHIFRLSNGKILSIDVGSEKDIYIPRIKWTQDENLLCITKMNRHQNHLQLLLADAKSGSSSILLEEKNKYYIDVTDNLTFLKNGKELIWTSEKSGYNHVYLFDLKGNEKCQITKGDYDVTNFYGYDEENKKLYFQAAMENPLEREVYVTNLKGKNLKPLIARNGNNSAQFSSTFEYLVNTNSSINAAPNYTVYDRLGKEIRVIEYNAGINELQQSYNAQTAEFFEFTTSENVILNGWMIKPPNFDASKKYPVFMYVYGGPGSQTVTDSYKGNNYWWFQMLAQNGYIVASVDNRGTGARGEEFKKMTYLQLGKYETVDQIEAGKYLAALDYTDQDRLGIFGWSYGGYMSSLCILKGADVFKAAIAVAPVTSWKWYDTVYTERYMRTLAENEDGYKDNSPVYFTDLLEGNYLIVHGNGDDNVHFQNTAEMANALISSNKQFDTYFYPNRNHGISGDNARLHLYTKMTNFIFEKL